MASLNKIVVLLLVLLGPIHSLAQQSGRGPSPSYVLQPMDVIRVQFFDEAVLDRDVRVSQEHSILLPLVGLVDLRGMTIREVETKLRELYDRDYLVNPQINVTVLEYVTHTINVIGQVNNPGAIVIPPEQKLTLVDAITRAGGFTRLANRRNVRLSRTLPDGRVENFMINADDLMQGRSGESWIMMKDDVIFVQERGI